MPVIDDAAEADLPDILALNQRFVPHVGDLTLAALQQLTQWASYFRVVRDDTGVVGFLLAMPEGRPYASPNYRWFAERYPRFVYIDRVAIAKSHHRQGLGRRLYEDLHAFAIKRAPLVACEVNTRPVNEESLAFHARMGYQAVGGQETEGGSKTVALMICTFD